MAWFCALCPSPIEMTAIKEPHSLLLIVSGPAGSGKTTLCHRMLEKFKTGMQRVVTATTRPVRKGEIDGQDYYFFSPEEFERRVKAGEFFEHANVHVYRYGILKSEIHHKLEQNIDLIAAIDVQGAATFRQAAKSDPKLNGRLTTIFISPQNLEQIHQRLVRRGQDDSEEIERRLKVAEKEMREWDKFDHHFCSSSREEDFAALRAIYQTEKSKQVTT